MAGQHTYRRLESVISQVGASHQKIIGIDGFAGSGKSWLADEVADRLSLSVIHLDEKPIFEPTISGVYQINTPEFIKRLAGLVADGNKVIVEGVTLLAVLMQVGITDTLLIYVKHLDHYGDWEDRPLCDLRVSCDRAVANWERSYGSEVDNFHRQLSRYHHDFKPTRRADLVFLNQFEHGPAKAH